MKKKQFELRMYGFVPYNISEIQKGIQFGHAVVEYEKKFGKTALYKEWAKNHKTFIILNGGTTNNSKQKPGSMQIHRNFLTKHRWPHAEFHEPDLNDALSAVVFIVDERIFNFKEYPDMPKDNITTAEAKDWIENIGGNKNLAIREYFRKLRLA